MGAGKVALVTGGAIRVGRAIGEALASQGYRLVVNYRSSAEAAEEFAGDVRRSGHEAVAISADVTVAADIDRLVEGALDAFGRIDLLVNNAAVFDRRSFLEMDAALWSHALAVNLTGPFLISQRVAAAMLAVGGGRIVNICGNVGVHPRGEYVAYRAAKAGLDELTRCMAQALAPTIQVNGVAPGAVLLPARSTPRQRRQVLARIPAQRVGSPRDVAAAVCFFAGAPDYITGSILTVDGGAQLAAG